ncbi:MAG TPA: helix-turn-helix transcriptional regulator [Bacteroidia bacterium]|jgi:transcriptional regulator with XRE-family HTH domain
MEKKFPAQIKEFGQKVKEIRMERGLTQEELGKEAGVDKRTIQRIERADFSIGLHIVFALAQVFNIKPYKLLLHIELPEKKKRVKKTKEDKREES